MPAMLKIISPQAEISPQAKISPQTEIPRSVTEKTPPSPVLSAAPVLFPPPAQYRWMPGDWHLGGCVWLWYPKREAPRRGETSPAEPGEVVFRT
ncbi:MAG: hypothetical protein LBJ11_01055 [Oscillospiraceae bacterium]|jgi:hypothetical protein|nr:hypothetical protein [Oscillospiraceae bacterium]